MSLGSSVWSYWLKSSVTVKVTGLYVRTSRGSALRMTLVGLLNWPEAPVRVK